MKTIPACLRTVENQPHLLPLKHIALPLLFLGALIFCSGCAHSLEVKNMNSYRNNSLGTLKKPATIGLVQTSEDADCQRLVKGVGQALGKNSVTVYLPYSPSPDRPVDVIANIKVNPTYTGSGWNFLINWPGFLVWAPAWNGYVYKADLQVEVALSKGADNSKLDAWTIPINLDLRHAEIDRTWTEIGWLEYGIIPLIGGFVFIQYDPDVTPVLMDTIADPIGDYIAQEIIKHLNDPNAPAAPAAPAAAASPQSAPVPTNNTAQTAPPITQP